MRHDHSLGVMEIFFGPAWTTDERLTWAEFLGAHGFDFYLYGPKADPNLRKKWRERWSAGYVDGLKRLSSAFHERHVQFGVILSPFQIDLAYDESELKKKIETLEHVGISQLGIFFDDMNYSEGQIESQLRTLEVVRRHTSAQILFCPTYYSPDPILDKVFGARPANYLERIGSEIPHEIDIAWTGPKVISDEISAAHLSEVSELLGRAPFLCDNIFANDGPKNCKFLKFRLPEGRSPEAFEKSKAWALNPMNQSRLSQIACLAMKFVAKERLAPEAAFDRALEQLVSPRLASMIREHRVSFLSRGLDTFEDRERSELIARLALLREPAALEIERWLKGEFTVGSECLTD